MKERIFQGHIRLQCWCVRADDSGETLRRPFKVESHEDQYNDRPLSTLEYHAIKLLELVPNFFMFVLT